MPVLYQAHLDVYAVPSSASKALINNYYFKYVILQFNNHTLNCFTDNRFSYVNGNEL